jgi:hypothetical protein
MQISTQGTASTAAAAAQADSTPLLSSRRGLGGLLPKISVLLCIGLVYVYVEYSSFPGYNTRQGTYHIQTEGVITATGSDVRERREEASAGGELLQAKWKEAHADQLACDFPYQKVDKACPRFVHLPITRGGGLGNKFFTYILGLLLAIDLKATHLYTGSEFLFEDHQDHGNYPWVEEVFQFGYREMNYSQAIEHYKPQVKNVGHQVSPTGHGRT